MKYLKEYKFIPYFIIYILTSSLLLTIINFIINISNKANQILSLIFIASYSIIFNIKKVKNTNNKILLSGLKYNIIHLLIIYLFGSLITSFNMPLQRLLYYLIILTIMILGILIGIKLKKE